MARSDLYFITFGGGSIHYRRAASRLERQAKSSGFFNKTRALTEYQLKRKYKLFWKSHNDFISSNPRGFGKWIWKPFIIMQILSELPKGSIIFYADAGCYLNLSNSKAENKLLHYLDMAQENGIQAGQLNPIPGIPIDFSEKNWNRRHVLDYFETPEEARNSGQIQATYMLITKNNKTVDFTSDWYRFCYIDDYFLLQDGMEELNDPNFQEHRFDQSIFSCLYKKYGFATFPDETWWGPNWQIEGFQYPIWAMRNRTGIDPFRRRIKDIPERVLLENPKIRRIFQKTTL